MQFPQGSHIQNQAPLVDNAKEIETELKKVDWRYMLKFYFAALGVLLLTIFALIVVIEGALSIF